MNLWGKSWLPWAFLILVAWNFINLQVLIIFNLVQIMYVSEVLHRNFTICVDHVHNFPPYAILVSWLLEIIKKKIFSENVSPNDLQLKTFCRHGYSICLYSYMYHNEEIKSILLTLTLKIQFIFKPISKRKYWDRDFSNNYCLQIQQLNSRIFSQWRRWPCGFGHIHNEMLRHFTASNRGF